VTARYGVIALLYCLLVAGSVWLVQNEGRAYRLALGRARQADSVDSAVSAEPLEKTKPAAVAAVATSDVPAADTPAAATGGTLQVPQAASAVGEKARSSLPPVQAAATQAVAPAASGRPSPPGDVPKNAPRLADRDPFWNQLYLTKEWDLDRLTAQDENTLGEELHNLIMELNPRDSGSGRQRIIEDTRQLVEMRTRKDIDYKFTILNSDIPNVFSHPGGFIYVSRGLLDMIAEDEDYLLEFVVGHEMAHVELQHALMCLRDQTVRSFKDGTLQKLYFLIIPHAYPKELEFAADAWAYQRMQQLGRTEHDRLAFLRKLESYAKANGFEDGQGKVEDLYRQWGGKPGVAPAIAPIENHLRAHTAAWDRLGHLKQFRDRGAPLPK
jgi:Peptidase family M48